MGWFGSGTEKKTGRVASVCETCKKKFSASESYIKTYGYSCIECGVAERARIQREQAANEAYAREENLDNAGAIRIWERLGNRSEAKRIRLKMREEGKVKVDQTVVHGDQVTKTEIKDSVLNRSNIGANSDDKINKLEKIVEMKDKGIIDDAEFKQMKKEILTK